MHTYKRQFPPFALKILILWAVTSCSMMYGHYSFEEDILPPLPCYFATWCWSRKCWICCTNKITNLSSSVFQVSGCHRATKCACATMPSYYSWIESMFLSWQYNCGPAVRTSATHCIDAIRCFHISESKTSPALNLECFNPYLICARYSTTLCTFNDFCWWGGGISSGLVRHPELFPYQKGNLFFGNNFVSVENG